MCTFVPDFCAQGAYFFIIRCFIKQDERNYKNHSIA